MKTIRTFLILAFLAAALPAAAQTSPGVPFVIQPAVVSAIANGTVTRNSGTLPICNAMDVLLNITTTGTATGTLSVYVEDSPDGGVTWDDLISSNTFALGASVITQRFFVSGYIASTATSGSAAAAETLAAGTTRQGPFGYLFRVREKMASASGSPVGATYTITAVCK
jgi:hypothetical protein